MPGFKKRSNGLTSKERKTIAQSSKAISTNSNPFENIQQHRKKSMLGTNNSQVRHTSKARSDDINKRKDTLLKDFWKQQKPSSQFVDKRQLQFDRTLGKVDNKRKKFQLGDDDDEEDGRLKKPKLSSYATLGDIDESIDRELFRDDYQSDDIDSRFSTHDEVGVLRNLKGISRGEISSTFGSQEQLERKLSKRERMNLRIRGFKEKKLERNMEREENMEMIKLLDDDAEDVMQLLQTDENQEAKEEKTDKVSDYDKFLSLIKKGDSVVEQMSAADKQNTSELKEEIDLAETEEADEQEEQDGEEEVTADSFINDESVLEGDSEDEGELVLEGDEDVQEEEDGEEATEEHVEKLFDFITSGGKDLKEKFVNLIDTVNGNVENETLFGTIVVLFTNQIGFNEWLSSDSTVDFGIVVDAISHALFKLTTKLPKVANDAFHQFLLETFTKYEEGQVPNLGELLILKTILKVYPLKERIGSPILSLTNLLIHLYLEKSSKFTTTPFNTRSILFLISLAIIIDTECTYCSSDVITTLKAILSTKSTTKKESKKPNLFKILFDEKEPFSCEMWAKDLLSKYSNHLANDFPQSAISNKHFKTLMDVNGFSSTHRNHIENYNLLFDGCSLDGKPIQLDEVKYHLNYKTKKPIAIKEYEPAIASDKGDLESMRGKVIDEDPYQVQVKTLRKKISKEKRSAVKELRKDNQFLRTAREQVANQEALVKKQKYKEAIDTMRSERMEHNQMDRKNKEVDKMKKQMRVERKNAAKKTFTTGGTNGPKSK